MSVASPHPEFKTHTEIWRKCRDCVDGEEAVKAGGDLYLPTLEGAEAADYERYKRRAMFYSASGRTVQGLTGAILRKTPIIKWPEARKAELETIGHGKESLEQLLKESLDEVIGIGRVGYLVDSEADRAQAYICSYFAESIVNWREEVVGDRRMLTLVVLREPRDEPDPEDYFQVKRVVYYRVLRLSKMNSAPGPYASEPDAFYHQQIWREDKKTEGGSEKIDYILVSVTVPTLPGGKLLREIPFTFVGPTTTGPTVEKPPILDLANVNISHYMNSADLEHGRHYTALPTPWVAGFDPATTKLKIGSGVAWVSNNPAAQCGMLEFTGAGLGALRDGMKDKEQLMSVLGARLLEDQKEGVEAAETVRIRHAGEQANLSNISMVVSRAFTQLLRWVFMWNTPGGSTDEISVTLNRDFNIARLSPQDIQSLMLALQAGSISWETWVFNLSRGEILPENVTPEEERKRVDAGLPSGMAAIFEQATNPPAPAGSSVSK